MLDHVGQLSPRRQTLAWDSIFDPAAYIRITCLEVSSICRFLGSTPGLAQSGTYSCLLTSTSTDSSLHSDLRNGFRGLGLGWEVQCS